MSSSERRRAPRVRADFPIQLSSEGSQNAAILRDVSEIGLRCVYSAQLEEMTQVRIGLQLPTASSQQSIEVEGAIVRCDQLPAAKGAPTAWDVAIYFTKVPTESAAALTAWIRQQQSASDELASRESGSS